MCGRVILTLSAKMIKQILAEEYNINHLNIDDFSPKYNVGPGQQLLSVISHNTEYRSGYLSWRFIPKWAKNQNEGYKYINARSETVHEKATYKDAFKTNRCLVICNGFYEWHRKDAVKRPFLFHKPDKGVITLAGIWTPQYLDDGTKEYGVCLMTTEANSMMSPIHHRMPVIIQPKDSIKWLHNNTDLKVLQEMMLPITNNYLETYEVSQLVNNTRNQESDCIKKISS